MKSRRRPRGRRACARGAGQWEAAAARRARMCACAVLGRGGAPWAAATRSSARAARLMPPPPPLPAPAPRRPGWPRPRSPAVAPPRRDHHPPLRNRVSNKVPRPAEPRERPCSAVPCRRGTEGTVAGGAVPSGSPWECGCRGPRRYQERPAIGAGVSQRRERQLELVRS